MIRLKTCRYQELLPPSTSHISWHSHRFFQFLISLCLLFSPFMSSAPLSSPAVLTSISVHHTIKQVSEVTLLPKSSILCLPFISYIWQTSNFIDLQLIAFSCLLPQASSVIRIKLGAPYKFTFSNSVQSLKMPLNLYILWVISLQLFPHLSSPLHHSFLLLHQECIYLLPIHIQ